MSKVLFAGPSLYGRSPDLAGIDLRAPAASGDLLRAVHDGASAIGLVDGVFDARPAVWHKEILHALSQGVAVFGASSIGALRAAECAAFGMVPVGVIARRYCDGTLDDDAAIALQHAPAELGYAPITEPLVDVEATFAALAALGYLSPAEHRTLLDHAGALFFKRRTIAALTSALPTRADLPALYRRHRVSLKAADALELIEALRRAPGHRAEPPAWSLSTPPAWRRLAARVTNA